MKKGALRAVVVATMILSPGVAQAKKADQVAKLMADGKCADAVEKIDEWEDRNAFGSEDYDLRRIRAQAGYCAAKAADTVDAYEAFVARFSDWPEAKDARTRLYDLAFSTAQSEGTARAMKAFLARYPESPYTEQARRQEEAWSFEDAAKSGDPKTIQRWITEHPDSSLREQAWEAIVQAQEGIYLLTAGGQPFRVDPVLIGDGGMVAIPAGLPVASDVPTIGVNLPGAGRGETSEWWKLQALSPVSEGSMRLDPVGSVAQVLGSRLGVSPPGPEAGLLELGRAPGSHLARVATAKNPLALARGCDGFVRYALTLTPPGTAGVAFPFAVECPSGPPATSPLALLLGVIDAAEQGHRDRARTTWAQLEGMPDGAALRGWLGTALGDPVKKLIDDRPGQGDWIAWVSTPTGIASSWLRADPGGARVLATRPGWAVPAGATLATATLEPACASLFGSVAGTLFCTDGAPRAVALDGAALGWELPSPEALAAAGVKAAPELDDVVSVAPRWDGELKALWVLKSGKKRVEVLGPAPAAWSRAAPVPPEIGAWLASQVGATAIGVAPVTGESWVIYRAFTGS